MNSNITMQEMTFDEIDEVSGAGWIGAVAKFVATTAAGEYIEYAASQVAAGWNSVQ